MSTMLFCDSACGLRYHDVI